MKLQTSWRCLCLAMSVLIVDLTWVYGKPIRNEEIPSSQPTRPIIQYKHLRSKKTHACLQADLGSNSTSYVRCEPSKASQLWRFNQSIGGRLQSRLSDSLCLRGQRRTGACHLASTEFQFNKRLCHKLGGTCVEAPDSPVFVSSSHSYPANEWELVHLEPIKLEPQYHHIKSADDWRCVKSEGGVVVLGDCGPPETRWLLEVSSGLVRSRLNYSTCLKLDADRQLTVDECSQLEDGWTHDGEIIWHRSWSSVCLDRGTQQEGDEGEEKEDARKLETTNTQQVRASSCWPEGDPRQVELQSWRLEPVANVDLNDQISPKYIKHLASQKCVATLTEGILLMPCQLGAVNATLWTYEHQQGYLKPRQDESFCLSYQSADDSLGLADCGPETRWDYDGSWIRLRSWRHPNRCLENELNQAQDESRIFLTQCRATTTSQKFRLEVSRESEVRIELNQHPGGTLMVGWLRNRRTKACLEDRDGKGIHLSTSRCDGSLEGQLWARQSAAGGTICLESQVRATGGGCFLSQALDLSEEAKLCRQFSGDCLEASDTPTFEPEPETNNGTLLEWDLVEPNSVEVAPGYHYVRHASTGKCLAAAPRAANQSVELGECGPLATRWIYEPRAGLFRNRLDHNRCLAKESHSAREPLKLADCQLRASRWGFDGRLIWSRTNPSICLDATPGGHAQQVVPMVVGCRPSGDQKQVARQVWTLEPVASLDLGASFKVIRHLSSRKCVTTSTNSNLVGLSDCNSTVKDDLLWTYEAIGGHFRSKTNCNRCLGGEKGVLRLLNCDANSSWSYDGEQLRHQTEENRCIIGVAVNNSASLIETECPVGSMEAAKFRLENAPLVISGQKDVGPGFQFIKSNGGQPPDRCLAVSSTGSRVEAIPCDGGQRSRWLYDHLRGLVRSRNQYDRCLSNSNGGLADLLDCEHDGAVWLFDGRELRGRQQVSTCVAMASSDEGDLYVSGLQSKEPPSRRSSSSNRNSGETEEEEQVTTTGQERKSVVWRFEEVPNAGQIGEGPQMLASGNYCVTLVEADKEQQQVRYGECQSKKGHNLWIYEPSSGFIRNRSSDLCIVLADCPQVHLGACKGDSARWDFDDRTFRHHSAANKCLGGGSAGMVELGGSVSASDCVYNEWQEFSFSEPLN